MASLQLSETLRKCVTSKDVAALFGKLNDKVFARPSLDPQVSSLYCRVDQQTTRLVQKITLDSYTLVYTIQITQVPLWFQTRFANSMEEHNHSVLVTLYSSS